jgi:hypothetical protein
MQFAACPAWHFSWRCLRRQCLVDDVSQGCNAASATGIAAKAFVDGARRLRAGPAVDDILDVCVGQDITRTNDHKAPMPRRETHLQGKISNALLNSSQVESRRLQRFLNKFERLSSLDSLQNAHGAKLNPRLFSTSRQAGRPSRAALMIWRPRAHYARFEPSVRS